MESIQHGRVHPETKCQNKLEVHWKQPSPGWWQDNGDSRNLCDNRTVGDNCDSLNLYYNRTVEENCDSLNLYDNRTVEDNGGSRNLYNNKTVQNYQSNFWGNSETKS